MLRLLWVLMLAPLGVTSAGDQPSLSVEEIMARVAANQDRGQTTRAEYVYQQRIRVATRRTNGKLAREETADHLLRANESAKQNSRFPTLEVNPFASPLTSVSLLSLAIHSFGT